MRILRDRGGSGGIPVYPNAGSLPVPPTAGAGSLAIILDDGNGNIAGMVWNGTMWVQAFGPDIVMRVLALPQHNFAATVDPTASNDDTEGYTVGSRWVNLTNDSHWVLVDSSTGAAIWRRTDNVGGGGGTFLEQKSGLILNAAFNPQVSGHGYQVSTVTFSTPFSDTNYTVVFGMQADSVDGRRYKPDIIAKTAAGFTVSLGSNVKTDLTALSYVATRVGEST